jgi:glycosyltransferase involved in cell wall biosynthesis
MKVAFIEDSVEMGGVQYSTFLLVEHLKNNKSVNVEIFSPNEGKFTRMCRQHSLPYTIYDSFQYRSTSLSLLRDKIRIPDPTAWIWNSISIMINSYKIKKRLVGQGIDLVVTKGLLNHFAAGLACKCLNIPVVWHMQDLISRSYFGLLRSLFNCFAGIIPVHIICDGKMIQQSLKETIREKSTIIINGIKTCDLIRGENERMTTRDDLGIPANAYVIGNLARITPWKGQEILLRIFIDYKMNNQNAYLLLVGSPVFNNDRHYKHLKQLIQKYDVKDFVIMPGYRVDLKNIFSAMDFFVFPSKEKDTSPLALLSAISAGLPVAISNIGSLIEIIELCPFVDVFEHRNWEELVSLMEKYENEEIRKVNGIKNREAGKQYFDISSHSEKMLSIFKKLLDLS